jgi:hypothetical protein
MIRCISIRASSDSPGCALHVVVMQTRWRCDAGRRADDGARHRGVAGSPQQSEPSGLDVEASTSTSPSPSTAIWLVCRFRRSFAPATELTVSSLAYPEPLSRWKSFGLRNPSQSMLMISCAFTSPASVQETMLGTGCWQLDSSQSCHTPTGRRPAR